MGAYLSTYAPYIPYIGAAMLPGVYDIPVCLIRVVAAYTNTVPVDAYRGAGRPEAAYVIERLVDAVARDIGMAPDALRRKNFIKPTAMPYETATGKVYDTGEFAGHLARAQEVADWDGFRKRARERAKRRASCAASALATYIEACGAQRPGDGDAHAGEGRHDHAADRHAIDRAGARHLLRADSSHDHLGLPPEQLRMVQGDTDAHRDRRCGTGGSSSIPSGGASVSMAAKKLADNLKDIAADALEASPRDLEFADGVIKVVGTDRAISFADLAEAPGSDAGEADLRRCLHAAGADLSERHAYRRSRDRRGDRRDRDRELRHRRRFRRHAESADAGRARCMAARCRASARR